MCRNSIRIMYAKKASIPNPVESLRYIKLCSSCSLRPIKGPTNFIICNCHTRRSAVVEGNLKLYWKSDKRPHFLR